MDDFESFLRQEKERAAAGPLRAPMAQTPTNIAMQATPEAGAAVAPQSFESFLRQVKGDRDGAALQDAHAATVVNSMQPTGTAAAAAPLSRELGLPQSAVETDLPRYQQQALAQRNAKVLDSNPIVARWVAANPDKARVAQDEYDKLGAAEQLWQGGKGLGYAALQGLGGSYNSAALGLNRVLQPWVRLAGNDAGDWWGHTMIEPRAQAKQAFELTGEAGFGQKASQMVGNLLGLLSQVTLTGGGQGHAVPAAAGAIETVKLGTQTAARAMAFPSLTESVNRSTEVYEKTGDAGAAYRAAASTYLFTTLQGLVPFAAPGALAQRLATGGAAGLITSEAQRGLNNVLMPTELQQKFDPQEALFQAVTGAALGGVFGPRIEPNLHAAVRQTYTETLRAEQATGGIERVQQLGKLVADSGLKKADPAALRDFIEKVTEDSDLEAVYIDPRILGESLKQSVVEEVMPELRQRLAESAATGADVRIPVADFAAHIAGTPLEAALMPHLKASPDGMTYTEGQQHFTTAAEQMKQVAEQAAQAQTDFVAAKTDAERVYNDVLGQLEGVKRFTSDVNKAYAALTRDFFTTLAERTGESPSAMFKRYALKIAAESPTGEGMRTRAAPVERTPEQRAATDVEIGQRMQGRIDKDFHAVSREYASLPETQGGKVLNTDIARELSPDYLANRTKSAAVHEASSAFIKRRYAEMLKQPPKKGEAPVVLFTAGGTGAGKSTAIAGLPDMAAAARNAQIVYDTNMNKLDTSQQKIEQALAAGKAVRIVMVARDPVDALVNGALKRAERQREEFGTGRTVPIEEHIKTHVGAIETINKLAEIYKDDPRVQIKVVDNSLGRGKASEKTLQWLATLRYNDVEQQVKAALEKEREEGRISEETYQGFAGTGPDAGASEGGRRVRQGDRPGLRGSPEPQRDQGQVTDEAPGREAKPGEPFIVYRLAGEEGLSNRNAGNADSVARHIMAGQGDEFAGSKADTVYAYEVTLDKPFGQYEGLSNGISGKGETVGRVARAKEVAYSFPEGGHSAKLIGSKRLPDLHKALEAEGFADFDDAGTDAGARAIRRAFEVTQESSADGAGRVTEAFTERGQQVAVQFKLVEAADLVTSHDDALKSNPEFPTELQPRDRARAASAEQIQRIENNIRPALLGDSAKASDGAPIVGKDGVVESGNARTIALRRAYGGKKAEGYREWLSSHAAEFGLKADDVKALKEPVLVRERLGDEVDRAEFARQANEGAVAAMSVTEVARSDAARLSDLSGLEANDDGTINQGASSEFLRRFMREAVGPNEAGAVMQKSGDLSAGGLQRVRNAIFAKAYGDADLVALLTESTDSNVRNILAGMLRAAPDLAKLRDMQNSGARQQADLAAPVVQAVRLFSQLRSEGRTVDQYLDQGSMFDAGLTPEVESMLRALQERSRAPKRVAELIQDMVADVDALGDPRQMGMFGVPAAGTDLIKAVADRALAQRELAQGDRGAFSPDHNVIALFKGADLSTFLHESGHFYLEVYADVAKRGGAPGLDADMQSVLKWFGVKDLAAWQAMDLEQRRPLHEKFARGFEAYLLDGKAPTAELRPMFARFRSWLLAIYKSVRQLGAEITPEVRGVFDRMLASSEAIQEAELQRRYQPLFDTAAKANLTDEQFAAYLKLGQDATDQALDTMQARSMRDMKWASTAKSRALRELQAKAAGERRAITEEVTREIEADPAFSAAEMLKAHKGADADVVAEMHGYDSADQMRQAIADAGSRKDTIQAAVDQRMLQRHGDLIDPRSIEDAANEAVHNEARSRFMATGLKVLTNSPLPAREIARAAKEMAENAIARKRVRELDPQTWLRAESSANRKAIEAAAKDPAAAIEAQRAALINNRLARAALNAKADVEKGVQYLKRAADTKIDVEYADQIAQLLDRFALGGTLKRADQMASLRDWIAKQKEIGIEPDIPPEILNEANRTHYTELTVEEFRGLVDTVKQIEHLGRLKDKLLTAKDKREFAAVRDDIVASIAANAGGRSADVRTSNTVLGSAWQGVKGFWADHIKAATWARIIDGGKDGGPMWERIIRPANEAGNRETVMRAKATKDLLALLQPVLKQGGLGGKGQYFAGIKRSLNREARLAWALNTGNAGNLQRLLDGNGYTREQIQPVLDTLTAADWRFVQKVWDYFDGYRPAIAEKERRVSGKEPDWVEPVAQMVTADGETLELKGGYYPIKYDPRSSNRAEQFATAEDVAQQMQGAYTSATTRRSYTKQRAEEVKGRPLMESLDGIYGGVQEVIHDLTWHEFLIDANRLLRDDAVASSIRSTYGPEVHRQFTNWLQDVAVGEAAARRAGENAMAWVRQGVSVSGLGFNIMSALIQPLGITQSIVRIGPQYVGRGIAKALGSPIETTGRISEMSDFMATRFLTRNRELNELRNTVKGAGAIRRGIDAGAYALMLRGQQLVDIPTWWGAYEKATAEGNDQKRAVDLADQAVIDSQGSGQQKDLAAIERGGPLGKLFTTFYSFFNTALNLGVQRTMNADSKAKLAADMVLLYVVPAVLGAAMKDALTPGDSENWDDTEKLTRKLAGEQLNYLFGLMFGLRDIGGPIANVIKGEGFGTDYSGPAGLRLFQDLSKLGKQIGQGEWDIAATKALVGFASDLLRLPAAQINRTITGTDALIEGKTNNPAAVLFGYQEPH